jgi:stearoyl-CoA desaturase (delta-9 desaturase)
MKTYLKASNRSIALLQSFAMVVAVSGLFFMDFSILWLTVFLVSYYAYSSIGVSMMMHRFWTHKGFEFKNPATERVCTYIAILASRGSPLAWVYIHRLHHAHADTEQDPHSPKYVGFRFFGLKSTSAEKVNKFMIKDLLNKEQIFINDYYIGLVLVGVVVLATIDINLFYFAWALPVFINQITQDLFNYFAHVSGYKNTETKDDSHNVVWLFPFILGEAWHNNHHASPRSVDFKVKPWELDPVSWLIRLVKTS